VERAVLDLKPGSDGEVLGQALLVEVLPYTPSEETVREDVGSEDAVRVVVRIIV
jgi:hypothetical protein